jgi:hypothetical protein
MWDCLAIKALFECQFDSDYSRRLKMGFVMRGLHIDDSSFEIENNASDWLHFFSPL